MFGKPCHRRERQRLAAKREARAAEQRGVFVDELGFRDEILGERRVEACEIVLPPLKKIGPQSALQARAVHGIHEPRFDLRIAFLDEHVQLAEHGGVRSRPVVARVLVEPQLDQRFPAREGAPACFPLGEERERVVIGRDAIESCPQRVVRTLQRLGGGRCGCDAVERIGRRGPVRGCAHSLRLSVAPMTSRDDGMTIGNLRAQLASERLDLLASPVADAVRAWNAAVPANALWVAEIDPELADTAAFCERYGVRMDRSANCVVLGARREGRSWFAACVVLATTRADVNGLAKKHLGASKISFAAMDAATTASAMESGGITPLGLPADWPILIDAQVAAADRVVIGSGVRRSKISLPGAALAQLPNAVVLTALGRAAV